MFSFFFSSRRRHTRLQGDWSSDVCSSDLKSMKFGGLTHDEALKLVTLNPAIQLGIDKRVGSIDVAKDADLVIYDHDPLSAYAVVQKTLIDGRVYFDRQRDIAERADREKEKKALLEKEKK